ncbi:NFAT activation molecule 1 isoform X2 [Macrotis lagotis]|uniref:NFAT activation molecule 1 isoform X2 n=1 Tax=Macrotis lagotis TaxID=92651 RepID=UPI003D68226F
MKQLFFTNSLLGGQKLEQRDAPILVTLARHKLRLTCEITSTPTFNSYSFSYYYVDLEGRHSNSIGDIDCPRPSGVKNKTHTELCNFTLTALHDASATGTYYCQVMWEPPLQMTGNGTFILVRDAEYKEPPLGSKKLLLFTFTGLLIVLSILGTGLVLWKAKIYPCPIMKKCRRPAKKILGQRDPGPAECSAPKPDQSGSIYTALQRHQSEVYDCLQSDVSIPPSEWSSPDQKQYQAGAEEFNTIYENF